MPGIIVEGGDQQGKSTLVKKLQRHYGWPSIHFVKPKDEKFDHNSDYLMGSGLNSCGLLYDRSFLSEMAYGTALRGGSEIGAERFVMYDQVFASRRFMLVLCERKGFSKIEWEQRREMFNFAQVMSVIKSFREWYDRLKYLPKIIIDPVRDQDAFEKVVEFYWGKYEIKP